MTRKEFEAFLPSFFKSLFELWVKRDDFPKAFNLANETGMTKIYQYPIGDAKPEAQGGTQQPRGQRAHEEQQGRFRLVNQNTRLRVLISPDRYVVVDLSDEANNRDIRYMAMKVITREGINKLEVTGLNYPDQNNKYRSGCSAKDLVSFMEKTNPTIIPERWRNAHRRTLASYMNDEFLRELEEEIISKEKLPLSRSTNYKFYFTLINDLSNEDHIRENIDYYKRIQYGQIFYVLRPHLEQQALEHLFQEKAIRMSAPKGMGKTMLLKHEILPKVKSRKNKETNENENYQAVTFNCAECDASVLNDYDEFFKWFLTTISVEALRDIRTEQNVDDITNEVNNKVNEIWEENGTTNSRTDNFLQKYLLPKIPHGLVIAFEKIDTIFERASFSNDFIPLLRTWWGNAKENQPNWTKLHLVLLNSSEVYARTKDNFSPDIGYPLSNYFRDFIEIGEQRGEVSRFIQTQQPNFELESKQITDIINLIGGSPYLLSILVVNLKSNVEIRRQNRVITPADKRTIVENTLTEILYHAPTYNGIYRTHYDFLLAILNDNPEMRDHFREVVKSDEPIPMKPPFHFKLQSLGLIKFKGNLISVKNKLYKLFFSSVL